MWGKFNYLGVVRAKSEWTKIKTVKYGKEIIHSTSSTALKHSVKCGEQKKNSFLWLAIVAIAIVWSMCSI